MDDQAGGCLFGAEVWSICREKAVVQVQDEDTKKS